MVIVSYDGAANLRNKLVRFFSSVGLGLHRTCCVMAGEVIYCRNHYSYRELRL